MFGTFLFSFWHFVVEISLKDPSANAVSNLLSTIPTFIVWQTSSLPDPAMVASSLNSLRMRFQDAFWQWLMLKAKEAWMMNSIFSLSPIQPTLPLGPLKTHASGRYFKAPCVADSLITLSENSPNLPFLGNSRLGMKLTFGLPGPRSKMPTREQSLLR